MAGKRFTRGIQRGARRQSSWFDIPVHQGTVSGATAVLGVSLTTAEKAKRPFTIVRTHMVIQVVSDQLIATELGIAAYGLCVVTDQAEAIGVTAIPTPVTDAKSDAWFLHQWLVANFNFVSGAGFESNAGQTWTLDSKAMRKVSEDEDLVGVIESSAISDGVIVTAMGRLLIKEH